MHDFEYIYVNWMNENSHLTMKSNTCLLQIFRHLLDQGQAFMSQLTAKYEGKRLRICRKGVSCTKWPLPWVLHHQLGVQQPTEDDPQGQLSNFCVWSDWWLAVLSSQAPWVKEVYWRSSYCINRKASNLRRLAFEQLYFCTLVLLCLPAHFGAFCYKHFCDMVIFWVMEISFILHQLWASFRRL